jgi:hypothetical protein
MSVTHNGWAGCGALAVDQVATDLVGLDGAPPGQPVVPARPARRSSIATTPWPTTIPRPQRSSACIRRAASVPGACSGPRRCGRPGQAWRIARADGRRDRQSSAPDTDGVQDLAGQLDRDVSGAMT